MQEFRQGLEEMGVDTSNDPYLNVYAPKGAGAGSRGDSKSLTRGTLTRSRELSPASLYNFYPCKPLSPVNPVTPPPPPPPKKNNKKLE